MQTEGTKKVVFAIQLTSNLPNQAAYPQNVLKLEDLAIPFKFNSV